MTLALFGVVIGPLAAAILCWQLVQRTLPAAVARYLEEQHMTDNPPPQGQRGIQGEQGDKGADGPRGRREPVTKVFIISLIASFLVITIGVQAYLSERDDAADERAAAAELLRDKKHDRQVEVCTQEWADAYRATTETRVDVNTTLRKANKRWATSVGGVFTVFIAALAAPPQPPGSDPDPVLITSLTDALATFAERDAERKAAEAAVTDTAEQNPYPSLDLSCQAGRDAAEEITE